MVGFFRLTVTSPSPLIGVRGGRWLSPSIETPPGARRSIVVNGLAAGVLGTEDCAGAPASPLDCRLPKATFVVESDTLRLTLDSLGVAFGSLGLSFVPRRKLLERDFISSGSRLSPLVRSCYFRCRRAGKRRGAAAQGAQAASWAGGAPISTCLSAQNKHRSGFFPSRTRAHGLATEASPWVARTCNMGMQGAPCRLGFSPPCLLGEGIH